MRYLTCERCPQFHQGCDLHEEWRHRLSGLRLTSVKFRCERKFQRFPPGAAAVVTLPVGYEDCDRGVEFQATVMGRAKRGGKVLVWIREPDGLAGPSTGSQETRHAYAVHLDDCVPDPSRVEELCPKCGAPASVHPDQLGDWWCPTLEPEAEEIKRLAP